MHSYTFRFYHRDGYLAHRVMRAAADLSEALAWAKEMFAEDHAMLEVLEGEWLIWRGTAQQARAFTEAKHAA